jgi:hypothetical protein
MTTLGDTGTRYSGCAVAWLLSLAVGAQVQVHPAALPLDLIVIFSRARR